MNAAYQALKSADGDVLVGSSASERLARVDAIVFDCDGTLIDVSRSYDAAIVRTASLMTRSFLGKSLPLERVGGELLQKVRRTGGFNSDWDMTYALTLFSAAVLEEDGGMARLQKLVVDFGSRPRMGWRSVDQYMASAGLDSGRTRELREYLGYPGNPLRSRMTAAFDQLYYGARLFEKVYGVEPEKSYRRGLIDLERVIVTEGSLSTLGEKTERRIAMATGRPFVAVEHTMGRLLGYFERDASVYIGDGDVSPELASKLSKFKKPSGESLILARKKFGSEVLLYVGDSAEDRLMVKNARAPEGAIIFAGIYGSSFDEREQISYFTGSGSELIVKDVNQIPKVLEMVGR